jgi:transcriptional regulator with XRE-family HTH domain
MYGLAKATGLSDSLISRYESGQRLPRRDTVNALICALGMNKREAQSFRARAGYTTLSEEEGLCPRYE